MGACISRPRNRDEHIVSVFMRPKPLPMSAVSELRKLELEIQNRLT